MKYYCLLLLCPLLIVAGCKKDPIVATPDEWENLLDLQFSKWEKFIGVPHYSITTLPNVPKGDGMEGTPLGLGNDPLGVFTTEVINGELQLHISGEIYGGLATKEIYGNYHLKLDFKWGEKKYEPRLTAKRDNGILYHCYGHHAAFWNVWMNSQELQVQEGDMGDYFALGPGMDIRASYRTEDGETAWIYDSTAAPMAFASNGVSGRCRRGYNMERPQGEWNTLELICLADKAIHVVNGKVVMVLEKSRVMNDLGEWEPLKQGRIQIQSEGAEAWYRNIVIKPITEIPEQYR